MTRIASLAVALSSSPEWSLLVKATLIVLAGLVAVRVAGKARASMRHMLLASSFVAVAALPLAAYAIPGVGVPVPVASAAAPRLADAGAAVGTTPIVNATASPAGSTSAASPVRWSVPAWPDAARMVWALGAVLFLLALGIAAWRFDRLRRRGLPWPESRTLMSELTARAGVRRPVELVLHEELNAPATCGWRQPTVLLPADAAAWPEADLRRALVHELEHVRRSDWALLLLARATCAVFWFNPFMWRALREMGLEAERACDDAAIADAEGVKAEADYAAQLVSLARRLSNAPAQPTLAMANRSDLSTRITAILDAKQPRGRLGGMPAVATLAAAVLLVLVVAPVRAVGVSATAADSARQRQPQRDRRVAAIERALYEASAEGDVDGMRSLIAAGADVNAAIDGDGSPLIGAARSGNIKAVTLLLDRGADPNMIVSGDGSPLINAAIEGNTEIVDLLLKRGALIDQVAPGDENALISACARGRLAVVKLLVARGANVNASVWEQQSRNPNDGEWRTPLNQARRGGHEAVVAYLLSVGARP